MTIQRADVLFPVNTTTVDTAAGIDIRLLDSAQAAATDSTQSVRWTHTQDGTERTFDPATGLVTAVALADSFQGEGWALRLTEDMTPVDNTNCNTVLRSQTLTVQVRCLMNATGGTNLGGVNTFRMRASLWRYDIVANTGVLILAGFQDQTWNTSAVGPENNTRKNTPILMTVPRTEFLANEVLLLQVGARGTTLVDASVGTTNYDLTLDVDDVATFLDFSDGDLIGLRQQCILSHSLIGEGLIASPPKQELTLARTAIGEGLVSSTKVVVASKTFNLIGEGLVSRSFAVGEFFDLIGEGLVSMARVVGASKTFTLIGEGIIPAATLAVTLSRTATGEGIVTFTKASTVSKTFNLIGEGLVSMTKNTQAVRTFNLIGEGVITRQMSLTVPRTIAGEGLVIFTKAVSANKTFTLLGEGLVTMGRDTSFIFNLIGEGLVTEIHPVSAFRTFDLIGEGIIVTTGPNTSTITIPIDEVPDGGGGGGDIIIVKKPVFIFDD